MSSNSSCGTSVGKVVQRLPICLLPMHVPKTCVKFHLMCLMKAFMLDKSGSLVKPKHPKRTSDLWYTSCAAPCSRWEPVLRCYVQYLFPVTQKVAGCLKLHDSTRRNCCLTQYHFGTHHFPSLLGHGHNIQRLLCADCSIQFCKGGGLGGGGNNEQKKEAQ